MAKFNGIDVSTWQGDINWDKVKKSGKIDFAIIRAGFGDNRLDNKAVRNVKACNDLGIPIGLYWFAYPLSIEDAIKEGQYLCDFAKDYKIELPLCYDFEYDSVNYLKKNGKTVNNTFIIGCCNAALSRIEKNGYYAMNYANYDYYINKGLSTLTSYDLWYAAPGAAAPGRNCGIWQYSFKGSVSGIDGFVDMNYSFKDYQSIISKKGLNNLNKKSATKKTSMKTTNTTKVYYTIKKGDTLSAIAKKYNTTVSAIMKLNTKIKDKNLIYAGDKIRVK